METLSKVRLFSVHFLLTIYNYIERFINIVTETKEKILIYDYTDKYPKKEIVLKPYYDAHVELYEKIEFQLEHVDGLQYARVIALPHGDHLSKEHSVMDLYLEFIKLSSKALFEHVCRTLSKNLFGDTIDSINLSEYDDIEEEDIIPIKKGFYIINKCSRIYQFALLDNIVVSEMYRYHITGKCYPDVLFIEQVHNKHPHYIITMKEFSSIFKENKVIGKQNVPFDEIDKLHKIDENVFEQFGKFLQMLIEKSPKDKVLGDKNRIFEKYKKVYDKRKGKIN